MTRASAGDVGRHLGRLFDAGSAVGLTDGELLERVAQRRDEWAEAAFEVLLARHGAMVLTVCRQVLGDAHAAEDTFQATFLVLVRRAGSLRVREPGTVGPWLYGVAYRIALKARREDARRRARERRAAVPAVGNTSAAIAQGEVHALLHEEVNRLPAKYRAPVVLCYLEGRTHDEAAAALQWPVGTVRGRLARARDLLRARLTRRGLAPDGWAGALLLGPAARIEPPARLLAATVAAAIDGMPAGAVTATRELHAPRPAPGAAQDDRGRSLDRLDAGRVRFRPSRHAGVAAPAIARSGRRPPSRRPRTDQPRSISTAIRYRSTAAPASGRFAFTMAPLSNRSSSPPTRSRWSRSIAALLLSMSGRRARGGSSAKSAARRPSCQRSAPSRGIALSPDGTTLATVDYPSQLRLWDMATGRERRRWLQAQGPAVLAPAPLPQWPDRCRERDGSDVRRPVGHHQSHRDLPQDSRRLGPALGPQVLPRRPILATATRDTEIVRGTTLIGPREGLDASLGSRHGQGAETIPVDGLDVQSLAFSPDGKLLAAAVSDGTVRLYDLTTGLERMPRLGPEPVNPPPGGDVKAVPRGPRAMAAWHSLRDGSILAAGDLRLDPGRDDPSLATIHLWDVARGRELHRIPAHQARVGSLSFSPDGKTLASTGGEPVVRLWDVATGREAFPQCGPPLGRPYAGRLTGRRNGLHRRGRRHHSTVGPLLRPRIGPHRPAQRPRRGAGRRPRWQDLAGRRPDGGPATAGRLDRHLQRGGASGDPAPCSIRERDRPPSTSPTRRTARPSHPRAGSGTPVSGEVLVTLRHQDPQNDRFLTFCPIFYTPDGRQVITAEPDGVRVWDPATGREVRRADSVVQPPRSRHPLARRPIPGHASAPVSGRIGRSRRSSSGSWPRARRSRRSKSHGRVDPLPRLLPRRSIPGIGRR